MDGWIMCTVAAPIEGRRSIEFKAFRVALYSNFAHFPLKSAFSSKKVAFCSRWYCNQEWRSIGADTVFILRILRLQ